MTDCGTPLYMAPEIFENKKYTDKADLWFTSDPQQSNFFSFLLNDFVDCKL
jgi:serine/threonine protein kinase